MWEQRDTVNNWTGERYTRHDAEVTVPGRRGYATLQVNRVGNTLQWSAYVYAPGRPYMAHGRVAATRYALPVAKMNAMRHALRALRAA
jgi:hypothetical protein